MRRAAAERPPVAGGHIGLFMGSRTLKEAWPPTARWISGTDGARRNDGHGA